MYGHEEPLSPDKNMLQTNSIRKDASKTVKSFNRFLIIFQHLGEEDTVLKERLCWGRNF